MTAVVLNPDFQPKPPPVVAVRDTTCVRCGTRYVKGEQLMTPCATLSCETRWRQPTRETKR
jgi:hypothetical protein